MMMIYKLRHTNMIQYAHCEHDKSTILLRDYRVGDGYARAYISSKRDRYCKNEYVLVTEMCNLITLCVLSLIENSEEGLL